MFSCCCETYPIDFIYHFQKGCLYPIWKSCRIVYYEQVYFSPPETYSCRRLLCSIEIEKQLSRVATVDFSEFIGKFLCWSLFFDKSATWRPTTWMKRDSGTGISLRMFIFEKNSWGWKLRFGFDTIWNKT